MKKITEDEKKMPKKKKIKLIIIIVAMIFLAIFIIVCASVTLSRLYDENYVCVDQLKPIIYLYPEEITDLSIKLGHSENLTCTYPKYEDEWDVIAEPNGNIIDKKTGRNLYALYWEGNRSEKVEFNDGFVVKGKDTIQFLEEKLSMLGLNERKSEEFIVYWLPRMQGNKYNLIRFATYNEIEEMMPLMFSKKPDTIIRVLMQYKALENPIEIPEQKLETPERKGFVAVEWGGSELD